MSITIVRLLPGAFDSYRSVATDLVIAAFAGTPKADSRSETEGLLRLLEAIGSDFLLGEKDGVPIGFAAGMRFTAERLFEPHFAAFLSLGAKDGDYYFSFIAVPPKLRDTGIAVQLFDAQLQMAAGCIGWARTWEGNRHVALTLPRKSFVKLATITGDVYFRREKC